MALDPFMTVNMPVESVDEWPPGKADWVGDFGEGCDTHVADFRVVASLRGDYVTYKLYPIKSAEGE